MSDTDCDELRDQRRRRASATGNHLPTATAPARDATHYDAAAAARNEG